MQLQRQYDEMFMSRAIALASKSWGRTAINPLVGAVIVKNNRLVGQGFHRKWGEAHAEVCALINAGSRAQGATLYVNLEPCCCAGRTPPCVEAIRKAGIERVVISMTDPNPLVNGKGIEYLRAHNILVKKDLLKAKALWMNRWYIKYITKRLPYVVMKIAISQNEKLSGFPGKYITSEKSRRFVHALRSQFSAVLVGINTIIMDDPYLDDRLVAQNKPCRIVIDPKLSIPVNANFTKPDARRIIITSKDHDNNKVQTLEKHGIEFIFLKGKDFAVSEILQELGQKNIGAVLVEGGGFTFTHFFDSGMYDEIYLFKATQKTGPGLTLASNISTHVQTSDIKPVIIEEDTLYHVYRNN